MLGSEDDQNDTDKRVAIMDAILKTQQQMNQRYSEALANSEPSFHEETQRAPHSAAPRIRVGYVAARGETRSEFFTMWSKRIELFVLDVTKQRIDLPSDLSANDRRELHQLAEKYNLSHMSEGQGADRHLVLTKDSLHYKAPQIRPSESDIEQLKSQPTGTNRRMMAADVSQGERPAKGPAQIESRYHLRRVVHTDESKPKYADASVEKLVRRLDRVTDQNRSAVEIGMTMEEFRREEEMPLEQRLAGATGAVEKGGASAPIANAWTTVLQSRGTPSEQLVADDGVHSLSTNPVVVSNEGAAKSFDEQCLTCGTRNRVDFDLSKWICNGYCEVCRRETIWKLIEVVVEQLSTEEIEGTIPSSREEIDVEPGNRKRPREEELRDDVSSDEAEIDEPPMTPDDAVDAAVVSDFPKQDTAFIRTYSQRRHQNLEKYLYFVISFSDLSDKSSFSFLRRSLAIGGSSAGLASLFVWASGIFVPGVLSVHATEILCDVCATIFGVGEAIFDSPQVALAFPSTPLFGVNLTAVLRIDLEECNVNRSVEQLAGLARKYGEKQLRFGGQLDDVISHLKN